MIFYKLMFEPLKEIIPKDARVGMITADECARDVLEEMGYDVSVYSPKLLRDYVKMYNQIDFFVQVLVDRYGKRQNHYVSKFASGLRTVMWYDLPTAILPTAGGNLDFAQYPTVFDKLRWMNFNMMVVMDRDKETMKTWEIVGLWLFLGVRYPLENVIFYSLEGGNYDDEWHELHDVRMFEGWKARPKDT